MDKINRLSELSEIVANLEKSKSKLYDLAQIETGEDKDITYHLIDAVQDAMTAVSTEALKIEKGLEAQSNRQLYERMGTD
jgi:ferredoxin-fold anticodon binding domain-containing protein